MHFDLDGYTVTLDAGDYSRQAMQLQEEGEEGPVLVPVQTPGGGGADGKPARSCWPTIMPIELSEPLGPKLFIWGEPVLRKYYTAYDVGQKRVGFGLAKHGEGDGDAHEIIAEIETQ